MGEWIVGIPERDGFYWVSYQNGGKILEEPANFYKGSWYMIGWDAGYDTSWIIEYYNIPIKSPRKT